MPEEKSNKTKRTTRATQQDIKDIHVILAMHQHFINILNEKLKIFKYGEENVKTNN